MPMGTQRTENPRAFRPGSVKIGPGLELSEGAAGEGITRVGGDAAGEKLHRGGEQALLHRDRRGVRRRLFVQDAADSGEPLRHALPDASRTPGAGRVFSD